MRPQPIQLAEIEAYGRARRYSPSEMDELIDFVQHLDGIYLERISRRSKGKGNAGT